MKKRDIIIVAVIFVVLIFAVVSAWNAGKKDRQKEDIKTEIKK
jgi:preprotein translocase subunit SecG